MDVQKACPGFMILEKDIAEGMKTLLETNIWLFFSYHEMNGVLKMKFYLACF